MIADPDAIIPKSITRENIIENQRITRLLKPYEDTEFDPTHVDLLVVVVMTFLLGQTVGLGYSLERFR